MEEVVPVQFLRRQQRKDEKSKFEKELLLFTELYKNERDRTSSIGSGSRTAGLFVDDLLKRLKIGEHTLMRYLKELQDIGAVIKVWYETVGEHRTICAGTDRSPALGWEPQAIRREVHYSRLFRAVSLIGIYSEYGYDLYVPPDNRSYVKHFFETQKEAEDYYDSRFGKHTEGDTLRRMIQRDCKTVWTFIEEEYDGDLY